MAFRRLLRGRLPWDRLEAVAGEVARRYDEPSVRVVFLEADNWLSTPCVVNDEYFVKIITPQHVLVHALLTTGRNLGAFSAGTQGFFEHFDDPVEMAEHELASTRRMRELGVNAPAPVEAFEFEGLGVLVLEYLPAFEPLDGVDEATAASLAPALFAALATMHGAGLAHGDLRAENVLVCDGELYFIDATAIDGADGAEMGGAAGTDDAATDDASSGDATFGDAPGSDVVGSDTAYGDPLGGDATIGDAVGSDAPETDAVGSDASNTDEVGGEPTDSEAGGLAGARAYDVACGLAALEPLVGARVAVAAARESYGDETLLAARDFLDFVNIRPDHAFDAPSVKGEIETVVD